MKNIDPHEKDRRERKENGQQHCSRYTASHVDVVTRPVDTVMVLLLQQQRQKVKEVDMDVGRWTRPRLAVMEKRKFDRCVFGSVAQKTATVV